MCTWGQRGGPHGQVQAEPQAGRLGSWMGARHLAHLLSALMWQAGTRGLRERRRLPGRWTRSDLSRRGELPPCLVPGRVSPGPPPRPDALGFMSPAGLSQRLLWGRSWPAHGRLACSSVTLHLVARWDSSWLAVCRRQSGSVLPGHPRVSLVYLRPLCCCVDSPPKATTEF